MKDSFKYFNQAPASASGYDRFVSEGLNETQAFALYDQISKLEPEAGKSEVSDVQKLRVVANSGMPEAQTIKALKALMTGNAPDKLQKAVDAGIKPRVYVDFLDAIGRMESDKDVNGKTISKSLNSKKLTYIDDLPITYAQKDELYYLAGETPNTMCGLCSLLLPVGVGPSAARRCTRPHSTSR